MDSVFLQENKKSVSQNKRFKISAALKQILASLILLLICSCQQIYDGTLGLYTAAEDGLSVIISNYARTIAPSTYNIDDIASYKIYGEDYQGNIYSSDISITNGTGKITGLAPTVWNFTLHAYSDASATNEVLCGYASVDTRSVSTVSFVLSSENVSGEGSCSITFKYDSNAADTFSDMVNEIHAYLCNPNTGEILKEIVAVSSESDLAKWTSQGYTAAISSISSGFYTLYVKFYQIVNASAVQIGLWTETVDIEPGRNFSQELNIPDIIARKPAAPENLTAYRIDSSLNKDSYNIVIRWDDCSDNEEHFVIKLREYSSVTDSTGSPVKTLDNTNFSSVSYENDGVGYVSGSLFYSSEEYVIKVPTGKLFDIEVYAENSFGKSDSVKRSTSENLTDETYGSLTGFNTSAAAPFKHITTTALTYNLQNGTLLTSKSAAYSGQSYIEYKILDSTEISLLAPADIADTSDNAFESQTQWPVAYYHYLKNGWKKWVSSPASESAVTKITTAENATFYAVYDINEEVEVSEFDSDALYITYGNGAAQSVYGSGTDAKTADYISSGSYITITVDRAAAPNSQFTRLNFLVNGVSQNSVNVDSDSTETLITYTFAMPFKGTYTVQVCGGYNETWYYSKEFSLKIN